MWRTSDDNRLGLPTMLSVFLVSLWLPLVGCGSEMADAPEEEETDAGESAASEASAGSTSPIRLTDLGAVAGPTFSPDGSKIAFLNTGVGLNERGAPNDSRAPSVDLYVINVDGTDLTNLTGNLEMSVFHFANPAGTGSQQVRWSPNGSKLVFAGSSRGAYGPLEIYVINVDGTNLMNLTNSSAFDSSPVGSPDGTKIAFASLNQDNPNQDNPNNREIYVMNSDGTDRTNLTKSPWSDESAAWSPDGTKIAFQSNRDNSRYVQIYVMNSDGTNPTRLTNSETYNGGPVFSPDGKKIAFVGRPLRWASAINIVNTDGTNLTNLTNSGAYFKQPVFWPDGRKVAFVSDPSGSNYEINVVNTDGTNLTNLTNNPSANDVDPAFLPDGKKMAYVSAGYDGSGNYVAELYLTDVSGIN